MHKPVFKFSIKVLYAASRELLSFLLRQPRSMVHALTVVKSTLCVKQRAAGGGRSDYYSKPLNEFKNSYFGAFAIQSLCLGLMQKMPFAFLLRGALSACVCVCVCTGARGGSQRRLIYTIFRCIITIHDHLCSSLSPEMCET